MQIWLRNFFVGAFEQGIFFEQARHLLIDLLGRKLQQAY